VSEDEDWWSEPSIALAFPVAATLLHLSEMQRRPESAGEEHERVDEEEGAVHTVSFRLFVSASQLSGEVKNSKFFN
jgi:hypothetical protein